MRSAVVSSAHSCTALSGRTAVAAAAVRSSSDSEVQRVRAAVRAAPRGGPLGRVVGVADLAGREGDEGVMAVAAGALTEGRGDEAAVRGRLLHTCGADGVSWSV